MKKKGVIFLFILLICSLFSTAQKSGLQSYSMKHGENIVYDLNFKWGFIMHAGESTFTYNRDQSVGGATSLLSMSFKTNKFFDGIYKMRDTMSAYYNDDNVLIYSIQQTNEKGYIATDELRFNYGTDSTFIHSLRKRPTRISHDTTLVTTGIVTDMLGVVHYIRGINRKTLKPGDIFSLTTAVGKDLVKVQFLYQHQEIISRGNVKYNTHYFKIDIFDEAFESSKTAAEVWIGDDDNFIPVKLRTKLTIGYAEVYYKDSSGLAHPLSCSIQIKK